jgi:superfamily I DNA/RNA helicase
MSFHQLCHWRVSVVKNPTGTDLLDEARHIYPGADLYDVQLPYALARSTEMSDFRYDAIVVDEGQDFKEEYWLPVVLLGKEEPQRSLYVFFDPNQSIYKCADTFPIKDPPFLLTANCRNTRFIHEAAYAFFRGEETSPPPIEGEPPQLLVSPSTNAQCTKIYSSILELLNREGVSAADIAVLVAGKNKQTYYADLSSRPLPSGEQWAVEQHRMKNSVTLDTVSRFKGLEAAVVFLCGLHDVDADIAKELYYVGISRAKSRLFLVGSAEECQALLRSTTLSKSQFGTTAGPVV